jgi:hypothetical protein
MILGLPVSNEVLGTAAVLVSLCGTVSYVTSILKGRTRPHVFTWLNWGIIQTIVFLAQGFEHAGPGRWGTAMAAADCLLIVALGLYRGEKRITRSDWVTFTVAMSIVPLWYTTGQPAWSVLLATVIDALGYYPTFRKSWSKPHQESIRSYAIYTLEWALSLCAMDAYNWTTVPYAAFSVLANLALMAMLVGRRKRLAGISRTPV